MYHVTWEIDIEDEDNAVDAARKAWEIMSTPGSIANVFTVTTPRGVRYEVDVFLGTRTRLGGAQDNRRMPHPDAT